MEQNIFDASTWYLQAYPIDEVINAYTPVAPISPIQDKLFVKIKTYTVIAILSVLCLLKLILKILMSKSYRKSKKTIFKEEAKQGLLSFYNDICNDIYKVMRKRHNNISAYIISFNPNFTEKAE